MEVTNDPTGKNLSTTVSKLNKDLFVLTGFQATGKQYSAKQPAASTASQT